MKRGARLAHFFLPGHSNNHKARILHSPILFLIIVKLVLLQFALGTFPKLSPGILGYAANISPAEVVRLTNEKRAAAGLNPVSENSTLSQAARAKGEHMLVQDYWAHVAPDGTEPWAFFNNVGYKYRYAGENLARDFADPNSAVEAWMASPTHRDNMLSAKYKDIGVAVVEGDLAGVDTTVIVQFFGTQLQDTLPVAPVAALESTPLPASAAGAIALATPQATPTPLASPPGGTPIAVAQTERIVLSPFTLSKGASLAIVGVLALVMTVDLIIISKRRVTRIGGRSFAHLAFFGMVIAIIIVAKAGQIL
ncbi:hypothetical protein A2630_01740 [Candidatus Woesebacteria bacterium RIFCSPHIGHO2_01_FULL_44_10]|uniref:SCP domain-containing protein n=1 Tax=Candidatus Woesebacteria bacterium RIFCSPLOWO2_01_FULL_44_14 TaxID=1802525 RepID=A0A1F8C2B6_9BACT|nr:MAG: hypothetical protein A2630_01740 [Candidatus Woesebacteria bacterium RIFCSPHIGHO2_01_FULL_44_10]OGM69989.1 MAG: hypothetical protein A2975_05280 [Candidatus Woesebacteria bacterium RIFCSPLOWO2_01_FULL_44_14]